ncbi:amidohydrolase 3 [Trichoderma longibrachiatum ATCC 18648]|uniref:Amidohydrolase 3 n=1 Tax=Trichoderma longibrachiatum ATCC 18648 TaxID=983965 RepID=A0A2T4C022_TRILO|nr:amidohydrolase 3 [Trichoderma longibrachiatum ATCC 18648]
MGELHGSRGFSVLINGKVYQSPESKSADVGPCFAECMIIRDGIIQYVGPEKDAEVEAAKAAGATIKDLDNHTVLPGFIDGHLHILLLGQSLTKVGLEACKNLEDIRSEIKRYAAAHPEVPRIFCRGWMHSMTPEGVDSTLLDDLDKRPIFVDTKDLHSTWCNTTGLEEVRRVMNIAEDAPDPAGGTFQRGEDGKLNGVFNESAVFEYIWPFTAKVASIKERKEAIKAAIKAFNAAGYTGMVDMAMDETIWEPLVALRNEEGLGGMRIAAYWLMKPSDSLEDVIPQVDRAIELAGQYNSRTTPDCRVVGIKVICDGIIDACTASLTEPYSTGTSPDPIWSEQFLNPIVSKAHAAGLQVALHAIGNRTIRMAIDVLEKNTDRSRRPRIEHLEVSDAEDAARLGKLGITASIQPVHSDPAILRAWPRLIGDHRCKRAFAYREFADGGAPLALGSDAPTAPHLPIPNMYVATTRRSYREPGLETVVNPEFALTVCQSVVAATHGSAYSVFADEWTGSLRKGLKADFVICDVELEAERLIRGVVKETWFEGTQVYRA